jgi:hypothetical protein
LKTGISGKLHGCRGVRFVNRNRSHPPPVKRQAGSFCKVAPAGPASSFCETEPRPPATGNQTNGFVL